MGFNLGLCCTAVPAVMLTSCALESSFSEAFFWPNSEVVADPGDFGLEFVDVNLETGSDTRVHGWFIPSPESDGRTVVFCHGNGINISFCHPYYRFLHDAGFNVFLYDYRGFGESWGEVSLDAMLSDMTYVMDDLRSRPEVDPEKIALYGVSIGSLPALRGAARYTGITAVVVEDVVDPQEFDVQQKRDGGSSEASSQVQSYFQGYLAIPWALDPETSASEVEKPLLYMSGAYHKNLGLQFEIYNAAKGPKTFWIIPGAAQTPTPLLVQDREYQASVSSFLEETFAGQPQYVILSYRARQRGREWVVQATVTRRGTTETSPWPVEISFVHQTGITFHRVWLEQEEQTFEVVLDQRPLRASGWRYRFVEGDPASGTWEPSRTPLARAHLVFDALEGFVHALREPDATVETAQQAEVAIQNQEKREAFSPVLNSELCELYWLVGKTLYASDDDELKLRGLEWLERCLTAIPAEPRMHYWPDSEELVGFHHGDSVAQASVILAEVYEGDGRDTEAVRVLEAASRVAPEDRAVQAKLAILRDKH